MSKKGFTLAEVLITLSIIGVVAALTVPTLVRNYEDAANAAKAKKVYSEIANAWKLYLSDNGGSPVGTFSTRSGLQETFLKKYFKYTILTSYGDGTALTAKALNGGAPLSIDTGITTSDGIFIGIYYAEGACKPNGCATLIVDLNGKSKGPNRFGYDIYSIYLMPDGAFAYKDNQQNIENTTCLKPNQNPKWDEWYNGGNGCFSKPA
ncbi:MAG: type II secretion system protein [Candidatus Gastranaerophilales bacterium]|nr:type II secretion system protein [Candidatus Gastranaerophilales bacterium]